MDPRLQAQQEPADETFRLDSSTPADKRESQGIWLSELNNE